MAPQDRGSNAPPTLKSHPTLEDWTSHKQKQTIKYSAANKSKKNHQNYNSKTTPQHKGWELWKGQDHQFAALLQAASGCWEALGSIFSTLRSLSHPLNTRSTGCWQNCPAMLKYLLALPILVIFGSADLGSLWCIMISENIINKPVDYWQNEQISCSSRLWLRKPFPPRWQIRNITQQWPKHFCEIFQKTRAMLCFSLGTTALGHSTTVMSDSHLSFPSWTSVILGENHFTCL